MRRVLGIAVSVGALMGCGGPQPMETAWVMPELAAHPDGHPFAPMAIAAGADRGREDLPRGDYPEVAFAASEDGFWRVDERRAVKEARATGRGLFIDFYAEWSEPSRRLDDEVLSDVEARAIIQSRYVPLRIDVTEESAMGREQLERFGVDRLPALVMLDAQGEEEDRVSAMLSARELVERIRDRVSER